mgnify:CR=1 FL=1
MEVKTLLQYYGYPDSYDVAKKWYDGYHFGNVDVYCPWDVLNYCDSLLPFAWAFANGTSYSSINRITFVL